MVIGKIVFVKASLIDMYQSFTIDSIGNHIVCSVNTFNNKIGFIKIKTITSLLTS